MNRSAVIVVSRNMSKFLKECMESILRQTFTSFKLIIVDDASQDNSESVVKSFSDSRIIYIKNEHRLGVAASRNRGIRELKDEDSVFFIDADCYADPKWLDKGSEALETNPQALAVEGDTAYVSNGYIPGFSEKAYHKDSHPGLCQTRNTAYKREVFDRIGGFDEKCFNYMNEDTDFFYRAKIAFPQRDFLYCHQMRVIHQKITWNVTGFFRDTHKVKYFIRLIKRHGRKDFGSGVIGSYIMSPYNLILVLFPPLLLAYVITGQRAIRSWRDFIFFFLYIIKAYYYRWLTYYYALQLGIFVL